MHDRKGETRYSFGMHRCGVVAVTLALAGLAACGIPASAPTAPNPSQLSADGNPAPGTVMACSDEVRDETVIYLGIEPTSITTPTWADRLYGCTYIYSGGSIALSIKELATPQDATAYANTLGDRLGRLGDRVPLGDGAFTTRTQSMVMQKDAKVLLVDTSNLPAEFGDPPAAPATIAQLVTAVIAACWTGG